MTLFCKRFFVVTVTVNFVCCFGYTKVNFFLITRNVCCDVCFVDNTLSKVSLMVTKFMTWQKILSYKTQKIMSNFCFDINTKWRVKPNNILLSISFVVDVILVCRVILQSFPNSRIFLELFGIFLLIR